MHSSRILRCCSMAVFAIASFGVISVAAAQDSTAEPTEDAMMSEMMMEGACPEGAAAAALDMMMGMRMNMDMTEEPMDMDMTEEPMMMATEEMDMDMDMTEEPMMMATEEMDMDMDMTEEPMMMATDEMNMMGMSCLVAALEGATEVPGPGDEDGYGVAFVSIDASTGDVCYDIAVADITLPAAAMHIHVNAAGISGDVVVPFPTAPDADGLASGCTTVDTEGLAESIVTTPFGYYVNVHTSDFPAGAVRGQLMSLQEAMTMMSDMGMDMMGGMDGMMEMTPEATPAS